MSYRTVKQYSDRGSLKNLTQRQEDEVPFSSAELRIKTLYDYATLNHDEPLLDSLGFITTDYIGDKNALPLSVYRLRKIVEDRQNKFGNTIANMKQDLDNCFFDNEQHCLAVNKAENRQRESLKKVASAVQLSKVRRSFWRVSDK